MGLKNGAIITGPSGEQTQLFFQNDKPTADVANALWSKPTDNGIPGTAGDWVWTGSDWVSAEKYHISSYAGGIYSATSVIIGNWANITATINGTTIIQSPFPYRVYGQPKSVFFDSISASATMAAGTVNDLNYWDIAWGVTTRSAWITAFGNTTVATSHVRSFRVPNDNYFSFQAVSVEANNVVFSLDGHGNGVDYIYGHLEKTGSPPNISYIGLRGTFRNIHP